MTEDRVRVGEPRATESARAEESSGTQSTHPVNRSGEQSARRSGRIVLSVPILLIGSNSEGKVFTEKTQTVVVSLHGAGILSRNKLMAEQLLVLREEATNREAEIRVVGEIGQQGKMNAYGVAFVDATLHFWRTDFPAGTASGERPATLLLECGGCGDVMELTNGDYEYDICAIHGGLAQYCSECGLLTVWRRTEKATRTKRHDAAEARKMELAAAVRTNTTHRQSAVSDESKTSIAAAETKSHEAETAAATASPERRSRVRAKVNFFACVRTNEFGDEVVRCIDMSKGGVSFRGEQVYTVSMPVEIAVPFAKNEPGVTPWFVRARIANIFTDKDGAQRCGVEFLRR
jgi:PilZ domain